MTHLSNKKDIKDLRIGIAVCLHVSALSYLVPQEVLTFRTRSLCYMRQVNPVETWHIQYIIFMHTTYEAFY